MADNPNEIDQPLTGRSQKRPQVQNKAEGKNIAKDQRVSSSNASAIPVIGIGASAGGIEALSHFFDAMPADSGCAFVVVLHLDPKRESEMANVLGARTAMSVVQVADGMRLAPNHVYVIAPNSDLRIGDGALHVSKPVAPRGQGHPVDVLFSSLAVDQHERAVAIVLSGTGSNGTEGLRAIRAEGGMSLVQAPETAKFDGMPRSAIAAGMADHILSPDQMPEVLLAYMRHGYVAPEAEIEAASPDGGATLEQVLELVRARGGPDFRNYKKTTLKRRVHRRLGLRNIETLDEYIDELRTNPVEVETLAGDLMISVTAFFRDAEAWKALAELVIAPMVGERATGGSVRVWVPACSTGEEAYSLAMLVTELAEAAGKRFDVKVFATDAQEDNLRKARDGIYPAAAMAGFPASRLRRFFEKLDGTWQVSKALREMVVFAPQNLLRDPPFSRLDLVSCRNVLIYLEPEAQQRIIALCHFALRPGGHLFLGNAETIGRHEDLFETVSKKWRIFRRLGPTRHDLIDYSPVNGPKEHQAIDKSPLPVPEQNIPAAEMARRALLERYAPASVLIDRKGRVLYFHGKTRDYLEQPPGEPTRDLLTMARDGLGSKLRAALREAATEDKSVTISARMRESKSGRSVAMTVMPLPASSHGGGFLLVSFAPAPSQHEPAETLVRENAGDISPGEHALLDELKATRAELQTTVELMETTNEELKASNEEATSMNEELQSTNEELETSKEELQSFNEELNTVNSQLQHKIGDLERATNDLNNLLAGSDTATLFLDTNFHVKWFSPATKEQFDLVSSDIGRPIGHFARKFSDENLLPDAETVLKKLTTIEAEVPSDSGRWYLRRMLPYRTLDNHIAGVVIAFSDITERKQAADATNEARIYAEAIVETIRQPLLVLDGDLRVQSVNGAFSNLFKVAKNDAKGRMIYDLGSGEWDIPGLRTLLEAVISKGEHVRDFEIEHDYRDIGWKSLLFNARKLVRNGGRDDLILLAMEDITERMRHEAALRESETQYRALFDSIDEGFCVIEKAETEPGKPIDFRYLEVNPAFELQSGIADAVGKTIRDVVPGESEEWFDTYDTVLKSGEPIRFERGLITNGRVLELYAFPLEDVRRRRLAVIFQDITARRHAEAAGQRLAAIVGSSDDAIISKDIEGLISSWNQGAERLFGYTAEEIVGKSIMELVPPERHEEEVGILESIRRGDHIDHFETVRRRKDGSQFWVSLSVSPLKDAEGKIIGASKIARDMTERRRADEHRLIMVGELNHRVKNTLAVVQSIASQTLGHAATIEEARQAFGSRLMNLAQAHDVLTRESWTGADLTDIILDTVKPHAGGENRFRIDGPRLHLAPGAALAVSMALHELSTNAAKYGALSTDDGHVVIVWRLQGDGEDRRLHLSWTESDGPPVVTPTRKGFGSRLIERALASELGGKVRVAYESSGVMCTIDAPMPERPEKAGNPGAQSHSQTNPDRRG